MSNSGLERIIERLTQTLERDHLVLSTTNYLRNLLQVDRVVLYYFYQKWKGQVTFESLSHQNFSILGSTGPDECFNGEYAVLYEEGRIRAIADLEIEPIAECHRDFLRKLQVRANLAVPILNDQGLWGLLIAHHCQSAKNWQESDLEAMQQAAKNLQTISAIQNREPGVSNN